MRKLVEDYEESGTPLLVFSWHRAPIEALAKRKKWGMIAGKVTSAKKGDAEKDFQGGKLIGLAGTIGAMAHGYTLTAASDVIFIDRSYKPGDNEQAEDRVHRITQTRGVMITDIVADHPVDRLVHEIISRKTTINQNSVEAASVIDIREMYS